MFLWPFNPPPAPEGILSKAGALLEAAYWAGVKDGAVAAAIAVLLLFLLFHRDE